MSYFYNYFMGKMKDGLIYPLGPFDENGKAYSILTRSRSFASHLHDDFIPMTRNMMSDELKKANICYAIDESDQQFMYSNKYLPYKDLPSSDFIKTGYFLISDIQAYESNGHNDDDIFWDHLTPTVYAAKLVNELKFGKNEEDENSIKDYTYFAYPDADSMEYESFLITCAFVSYIDNHYDTDVNSLVVIENEG